MQIEVSLKDKNGKLVVQTIWYRNYDGDYVLDMGEMIQDVLIPVAQALIDKKTQDWDEDLEDLDA